MVHEDKLMASVKMFAGNVDTGNNDDSGLLKYRMATKSNGRRITYMLIIRYLTEEDAGSYICSIRIQGLAYTQWPKKIGLLTVQSKSHTLSG